MARAVRGAWRAHGVLQDRAAGYADAPAAIELLGGPRAAARRLGQYLSLPPWMLPDSWGENRPAAAALLGLCGPRAVRALARALRDSDGRVRDAAAQALGRIGPEAKAAVGALAKALGGADEIVRFYAALALGQIGPEARETIPVLEKLAAGDPDDYVRRAAAGALEKIRAAGKP